MPEHFNELEQNKSFLKCKCSAFFISGLFLCIFACMSITVCTCVLLRMHDKIRDRGTVSPHLSHACASVCVYSSLCAQSWPEGQTDVVNTSQSPLRIGLLHKRKNTLFALEINRCITSHLRSLEAPTVLSPTEDVGRSWATTWESISHCYGWPSNDITPFK